MFPITGGGGQYYTGPMGPGNPLNQGVNPGGWNIFNRFANVQASINPASRITGNIVDAAGNKVTQSGVKGAANATTTAIPQIGNIQQQLANIGKNPKLLAAQEVVAEQLGLAGKNIPKGAKGALQGIQGAGGGVLSWMAPKASKEAAVRGFGAARNVLKAGGTTQAARIAAAKPGIKIAGRWLGYRIPVAGAALDLAAGDPLGAAGTAVGGTIGAFAGGPVGATVGSMIGGPILKGGRQILSPIFGDPNDPLSGRDWSIGGMPITPYAKTKSQMEKQARLYSEIQMPLMEQINNAQFQREMRMARLGMLQNMMSSTNSLMSQAYATSSY